MNYYNDNDPFAAKWLRCLIRDGLIPDGDVDERPIQDVEPEDLKRFTQCHFFAGIGGWSRALQIAGWPADEPVWTGSCPCQPLSIAGKQQGEKDERHLWPEFYRLISQCRPVRIFGEQSESPDGIEWLDGISLDLEEIGYAVGAVDLPSACVGAPNKRQRAWWVAESNSGGLRKGWEPEGLHELCHKRTDERLQAESTGPGGRLANAMSTGRSARETGPGRGPIAGCCPDGGLGNPNGERSKKGEAGSECSPRGMPWGAGQKYGRLGNTERPGLSVGELQQRSHGKDLEPSQGQGFIQTGFWDQYRIIGGRDGKSRRIPVEREFQLMVAGLRDRVDVGWIEKLYGKDPEGVENFMSMFPLNKRIPGRVGFLRGAGNAINPWVAAEFIRAYMEINEI